MGSAKLQMVTDVIPPRERRVGMESVRGDVILGVIVYTPFKDLVDKVEHLMALFLTTHRVFMCISLPDRSLMSQQDFLKFSQEFFKCTQDFFECSQEFFKNSQKIFSKARKTF
jgi:hypothetical protein